MEQVIVEINVSDLKSNLNLTPEQESSIRSIINQRVVSGFSTERKYFRGELSSQECDAAKQQLADKAEKDIKAQLTAEQIAICEKLQKEESERQAREAAKSDKSQWPPENSFLSLVARIAAAVQPLR